MIERFVEQLAFSLEKFGTGAYAIVTLLALLETLIVVGQFIPGSIFLVLVGFLCYMDVFEFYGMAISVILARVGGEYINYALGRYRGRAWFHPESRFLKPRFLEMAETRFAVSGANLLVWGQFLGFLRPFITVAAGAAHYSVPKFTISVSIGAILWGMLHLVVGYAFGASWERAVEYLKDFSLVLIVAIPVAFLSGWAVRQLLQMSGYLYKFLERLNRLIRNSQWYQSLRNRHPAFFPFLERRVSLSRNWGLGATFGFACALACLGACLALYWDVHTRDTWYVFDLSMVNLLAQLRTPGADHLFIIITNLGAVPVVAGVLLATAVICYFCGQHKSLFVILGSVLLSLGLALAVEYIFQRNRPDLSVRLIEANGFSFPSSRSTVVFALFGAIYYWLWNHPGVLRVRAAVAFLLLLMAFLVGFSRVYLGVHYPSDIVSGFCLGFAAVLTCGTIAANWPRLKDVASRADYKAASILAVYGLGAWLYTEARPANIAVQPVNVSGGIQAAELNDILPYLPRKSTTLFGAAYVPVNLILQSDPAPAKELLEEAGFDPVASQDFFTIGVANPVFPAFVNGKPAAFTYEKRLEGGRDVVRLWATNAQINGEQIWVGSIVTHDQELRWKMDMFQQVPDLDYSADKLVKIWEEFNPQKISGFRPRGLYSWRNVFFTHGDAWFFAL